MDHGLVCMPTGNSIFVVHSNFLSASFNLSHLLLYLNVELLGAFFVIAGSKQLTFNANFSNLTRYILLYIFIWSE